MGVEVVGVIGLLMRDDTERLMLKAGVSTDAISWDSIVLVTTDLKL